MDKKLFLVVVKNEKFEAWLSYHKFKDGDIDFVELTPDLEEKIIKETQIEWREFLKTHHVDRQEDSIPTLLRMFIQKLKSEVERHFRP